MLFRLAFAYLFGLLAPLALLILFGAWAWVPALAMALAGLAFFALKAHTRTI